MKAGTLLVVLLAGCASMGTDVNVAKDSWHGATFDAVVSRWGTPTRSTTLADGREARTWVSEHAASGGSYFPSIGVFGGSGGGGTVTTGERYQVRAKISMLFREANLHEDRQTEEGRVKAGQLRAEANGLNEGLKSQRRAS